MFRKLIAAGIIGTIVIVSTLAQAATWRPLGVDEAAAIGATHVASVSFSDLASSTDTNTALVLTNLHAFAAKDAVECVGLVLEKAFDTGNTNYTGSCLLTVGDSADADLFLTSTELASDGTEVWVKFGRGDVPSIASTPTLQTRSIVDLNTNTVTVVTNIPSIASTATEGVRAQKVYTAANYLKLTFTPNAEEALSANTVGAARIYFRILTGGK